MAIKVQCQNCSASFKAKDELAGRRVKCPKCKQPISIPAAAPAPQPVGGGYNPLLDLLDDEEVKSVTRGPVCDNCGSEVTPGSVICIDCGFNQETGSQLETEIEVDDVGYAADSSMTDAERIMAKAERDIEDMPVTSDEQDFGDGSESYVIAMIAAVIGMVLIGVGLIIILSMEQLSTVVNPAGISFVASIVLYNLMGIWLTVVAFKVNRVHGIVSIATGFVWAIVFGFMQGKTLLLPAIIMIVTLVMYLATGTYVYYNGFGPVEG
ncbi:MAG: MJ0042-type zinc finger domain-containing protein [Planctomycetota bacterium]